MSKLLFCTEVVNAAFAGTGSAYSDPKFNALIGQADKFSAEVRASAVNGSSPTVTVKVERSNDGVNWDSTAVATLLNAVSISGGASGVVYAYGQDLNPTTMGCFGRLLIQLGGTGTLNAHVQIILTGRES